MKPILQRFQKRVGRRDAEPKERNEYYENISAKLGIFQVVLYLTLFSYVILSFAQNTGLITYQNFYYFFKDLNTTVRDVDTETADSVTYPRDTSQSFTVFRKGLSVVGNQNVTVFTATGRQSLSQLVQYSNPVAVASDKYLLAYEQGGRQFSLYNSFTQVYAGTLEQPILGAAISDSGMFALITESNEYTSTVLLYSSRFSLIGRYQKTGYVMDVAINEKGSRLAILTSKSSDGFWDTELELYQPGEAVVHAKAAVGTAIGLSCAFTSSGLAMALAEDRICFIGDKGEIKTEYLTENRRVLLSDLGEDGAVLCLESENILQKNNLTAFDKNGKVLYNGEEPEKVEQLARSGNALFLMTASGVGRLDLKNGGYEFASCNTRDRRLLAIRESELLICSPQKAEYITFQ